MNNLIKKLENNDYDFYGFQNKEPIGGNDFYKALVNSKMGLNLSRGLPTKHYSSNRIASLMGNGLLTFIDHKTYLNDFFTEKEIVFYKDIDDLSFKLNKYKKDKKIGKKIAEQGKKKYLKSDIVINVSGPVNLNEIDEESNLIKSVINNTNKIDKRGFITDKNFMLTNQIFIPGVLAYNFNPSRQTIIKAITNNSYKVVNFLLNNISKK